ncbi:hypothetical protein KY285_019895 [Solanum tuberosum]|nr:hypothetical protein KY285_019895 [Solanum tuberosum]
MEDHLKRPLRTTGVKRKILTDVDKPLQTVERVLPSNDQIEDAHVHEPRVKKRQKKVKRLAISDDNVDGGLINGNFRRPSTHRLKKNQDCTYCHALRFEYEPPTFCCASGCINLAPNEVADDFYELFVVDSDDAKLFRKNIRAYNSIFAFTSFGVKLDKELASSRKEVYSFKAQGQIYHDLPSLIPNNDRPRYFQLYFYDTDHELANRMTVLQDANLSEKVMTKIRNIMEGNPYAKFFSQLKEHTNLQNLQVRIAANASLDQRVYNKPSVDQVATIWVDGNNPNTPFERDIAVHEHSGNKHRVKHYYGCYDPLQYPLILPKGEAGWHQEIQKCRKQINNSQTPTNTSIKSAILSSTTAVGLLANEAQGIVDNVSAGECRGDKVGQMVLLPGSFIGEPRDMRRRYMDAMALIQEFGRPDVFITMTCNPDWVEIQEQLHPGQLP